MLKKIGLGALFLACAIGCLVPVAVAGGILYAIAHFVLKFW
jgi:hypothetical protein